MDSNILNKLRSSDYLDHIAGMDAFIAINNEIAAAIIHDLKIAGTKLFIVERIHTIVNSYITQLITLANDCDDEEQKFYIYFLLCKNKIYLYTDFIIYFLSKRADVENYVFAIDYLAELKVDGIVPLIQNKIELVKQSKHRYENHLHEALLSALVHAMQIALGGQNSGPEC